MIEGIVTFRHRKWIYHEETPEQLAKQFAKECQLAAKGRLSDYAVKGIAKEMEQIILDKLTTKNETPTIYQFYGEAFEFGTNENQKPRHQITITVKKRDSRF